MGSSSLESLQDLSSVFTALGPVGTLNQVDPLVLVSNLLSNCVGNLGVSRIIWYSGTSKESTLQKRTAELASKGKSLHRIVCQVCLIRKFHCTIVITLELGCVQVKSFLRSYAEARGHLATALKSLMEEIDDKTPSRETFLKYIGVSEHQLH